MAHSLINLHSILLMSVSACFFMTLMLYSASRSFPASMQGLKEWALGSLLMAICGLLFFSRGFIPDFFSIVIGNLSYVSGLVIWLTGCRKMLGKRYAYRQWVIPLSIFALLLLYFTEISPSLRFRLIIISIVISFIYTKMGYLVFKKTERSFARDFWVIVLSFASILSLGRLASALNPGFSSVHLFYASPEETIYFAALCFLNSLNPVGFFLLATHRLSLMLESQTRVDLLTGLPNRRALFKFAQDIWSDDKARNTFNSILVIDLDFFKQINDHFGHAIGDQVLQHFSSTVNSTLRSQDILARLGGEEFVLLLPGTNLENACKCAERIQRALNSSERRNLPNYTCSIGIAVQMAPDESFEELFERADKAMYRAKRNGRNAIEVAEPNIVVA